METPSFPRLASILVIGSALALAGTSTQPARNDDPYARPNNSWISISGDPDPVSGPPVGSAPQLT